MILDSFKLDEKTAFVTGAGQGLGQAMALALAEAGADVAGLDLHPSESTAEAVRAMRRKYQQVICDLLTADMGVLSELTSKVAADLGRLDILVNNAGITRALANEWAKYNVNVNAIAPGYMATDNTAALRADPDRAPAILARIPAGRWGLPDDLKGVVVFLASPASDYLNGEIIPVDGGWLTR